MKNTIEEIIKTYISEDIYALVSIFPNLYWTEEIRIRNKSPIIFKILGEKYFLTKNGLNKQSINPYVANKELIENIFNKITNYSLYSFNEEIKKGYVTLKDGHRVGISGEMVLENGEIITIKNIRSYNFRISKNILNISKNIREVIGKKIGHTLIFGAPATGKTTVLRDIIKEFSKLYCISVVDERGELTGDEIDMEVDILKNCPKAIGMMIMLRSMAPEIICVDEIGQKEDIFAIEEIINCGVNIIASIHGKSIRELENKPYVKDIILKNIFEYYVELDRPLGKNIKIYDRYKNRIY